MNSGSIFLLAARQCEIADLEELARTGELVAAIGRFVHALQRERGLTNVFLGSQGRRFGEQRVAQLAACAAAEKEVRRLLDALAPGQGRPRNGARLFSRVALVLHGLDALPALRGQVGARAIPAREATAAFTRLVGGLLAVVFEAADSASDPQVSRALVALFHFMQGKEFAGQERALGSNLFAAGAIDVAGQQQWRHLVDVQQGCMAVFTELAGPEVLRSEQASRDPAVSAEVERLRRVGCTAAPGPLDGELGPQWYDWATRRIDGMQRVEEALAAHLRHLCEARIAQARAELSDQQALLEALAREAAAAGTDGTLPLGPPLERSLLALVQEQARRLQAMGDELDAVRASLNERKVVERAKGLLMAHRQMSEGEAYKALRQMAMNQNRRLVDVAQAVLSLAEVLPAER